MDKTIFLILGMALVTYGPRLAPFFLIGSNKLSKRADAFLKCIPVAAIGALIIPGVFSVIPDEPLAVICGMGFAAIIGVFRGGIIIPVLGSVIVTYLILLLSA